MTFQFSGLLLRYADYNRTVDVSAGTLGEALTELEQRFPALRSVLCDNTGELRRTHRMFVNDELVSRPSTALALRSSDRVELLTAIAGG
jgi:molybdopterin converting factor small subunit